MELATPGVGDAPAPPGPLPLREAHSPTLRPAPPDAGPPPLLPGAAPLQAGPEEMELGVAREGAAAAEEGQAAPEASPELYHEKEALLRLLEGGGGAGAPVKLLRGSWLMERAAQLRGLPADDKSRLGLKLPRRQDLERDHPEAFVSAEEVRALGSQRQWASKFGLEAEDAMPIVTISHGWLTRDHPDPWGVQLVNFADQVEWERRRLPPLTCRELSRRCLVPLNLAMFVLLPLWSWAGLSGFVRGAVAGSWTNDDVMLLIIWMISGFFAFMITRRIGFFTSLPGGEFAVFYDFGSLHQKDLGKPEGEQRTGDEQAAFKAALDSMGAWYSSRYTVVFVMTNLPPLDHRWPTALRYEKRGWTAFEHAVASLVKPRTSRTFRRVVDPAAPRDHYLQLFDYFLRTTRTVPHPRPPRKFRELLEQRTFTNGADKAVVAELYENTLRGALGGTEELLFGSCGWGDAELEEVLEVLPLATSATGLNLRHNRFGARGWSALAHALSDGAAPRLRHAEYDWNLWALLNEEVRLALCLGGEGAEARAGLRRAGLLRGISMNLGGRMIFFLIKMGVKFGLSITLAFIPGLQAVPFALGLPLWLNVARDYRFCRDSGVAPDWSYFGPQLGVLLLDSLGAVFVAGASLVLYLRPEI